MAERRMFCKTVIDSDLFLDMPASAQALYFHLAMRADDDGFVGNPRRIMRMLGSSDDDARLLLAKQFLLPFDGSGVLVIRHWRMHNYIQRDRYKPTAYKEEMSQLILGPNKEYEVADQLPDTECIHDVSNMDTQVRLELGQDKVSLGQSSVVQSDVTDGIDLTEHEKEMLQGGFYSIDDILNLRKLRGVGKKK